MENGKPDSAIPPKWDGKAVERIKKYYSWEDVTDKYEMLFKQVTSRV